MEDWKGWKIGRVEDWKVEEDRRGSGWMEEERMGDWKTGLEGWKIGRWKLDGSGRVGRAEEYGRRGKEMEIGRVEVFKTLLLIANMVSILYL